MVLNALFAVALAKVCKSVTDFAGRILSARAPGKLIVCGEYSVLESSPALVAPVDRYFEVGLSVERGGEACGVSFESQGLQTDRSFCEWQSEHTVKVPENSLMSMAVRAFNALAQHYFLEQDFREQSWALSLDSSQLFDAGRKLGLGSSAAMLVALDSVLSKLVSQKLSETLEQRWLRLHRLHSHLQGKQGSGVDIAAMVSNELSVFRNIQHGACVINGHVIPEGVYFAYIWSGQSASTPSFLNSLSAWSNKNPSQYQRAMASLGEASSVCCKASSAETFCAELAAFTNLLFEFDQLAELGVFSGGMDTLFDLSRSYAHTWFKPCGAGGGDLGLAFSTSQSELLHYIQAIENTGFDVLSVSILENRSAVDVCSKS